MRLDHIIVSYRGDAGFTRSAGRSRAYVSLSERAARGHFRLMRTLVILALNAGGHSGEAIPVPIPNTEVKLSNADDTGFPRESR